MKERAFTLIELLAVIVILAIIALIATPIILGIINDARENSKKRSAELVYTGVEYAYTQALFKEGNGNVVDDVSLETINKYLNVENVTYHGFAEDDEDKEELHIQTKDNVYCKVVKNETTKTFDVSCGTNNDYSETNVMTLKTIAYDVSNTSNDAVSTEKSPKYYGFVSSGNIGDNLENLGVDTNPPSGKYYYLGFDTEDGETVSAAYACFKVDGEQYCLKGGDSGAAYGDNQDVMREASPSCSDDNFDDYSSSCNTDDLVVRANLDGDVDAYDGFVRCIVQGTGDFGCY